MKIFNWILSKYYFMFFKGGIFKFWSINKIKEIKGKVYNRYIIKYRMLSIFLKLDEIK